MLTITGWAERRRRGSAARDTRAIPVTLTSSTRAHSASSFWLTSPAAPMPALLTSTSRPPSSWATTPIAVVDRFGVGDVAGHGEQSVGGALDAAVEDRDLRAAGVQQAGGGRADTAGAAGHHGHQAVQIRSGHFSPFRESWVDVDLGSGTGAVRSPAGQHWTDLVQADRRGDQGPWVDRPVGIGRDGRVESR